MRAEVATNLSDSAFDFKRVVWPAVSEACGGGTLLMVEAVETDVMRDNLDRLAGIDSWQVKRDAGLMRGLASRIQWGHCWRTFTIRTSITSGANTELDKRLRAICEPGDHLYPGLVIHAYVNEPRRRGTLMAAGVVCAADLFWHIKAHLNDSGWLRKRTRVNPDDGNEFLYVTWEELREAGIKVIVVENPKPETEIPDMARQALFERFDDELHPNRA